jgi:hypothetical protein
MAPRADRRIRLLLLLFMPIAALLAGIGPSVERPPARQASRDMLSQDPRLSAGSPFARLGEGARRGAAGVGSVALRAFAVLRALPSALLPGAERQESVVPRGGVVRALPERAHDRLSASGSPTYDPPTSGRQPFGASLPIAAGPGSEATLSDPSKGPRGIEAAPETDGQSFLRAAVASALKARYRIKSQEELKMEGEIEAVFREYFKDYSIAGRSITVRMPFGLNGEREGSRGFTQSFYQAGKGTPEELWSYVDSVFASAQFAAYLEELNSKDPKVLLFDLERHSCEASREPELIATLGGGTDAGSYAYPGTATRLFVYRPSPGVMAADLYNYLYAVAAVGVDCSGLVHHVHRTIAQARGVDLDRELARLWRIRPSQVRYRIGLWFYDPEAGFTEPIPDRIEDLRPGDLLLFEGSDGSFKHSAVIQSIDFEKGAVRYVQSTDWAPQSERGVHESIIRFDPARPDVDLHHYSVRWLQQVRPPFEGETEPRDWVDDGDRYLWYLDAGGSRAVRLKSLAALLSGLEPRYYANVYRSDPVPGDDPPGAGSDSAPQTAVPSSR